MPGNSEPESLIHIHLTMVRQPSKRAFAGTGQSRRREKMSARSGATSSIHPTTRCGPARNSSGPIRSSC